VVIGGFSCVCRDGSAGETLHYVCMYVCIRDVATEMLCSLPRGVCPGIRRRRRLPTAPKQSAIAAMCCSRGVGSATMAVRGRWRRARGVRVMIGWVASYGVVLMVGWCPDSKVLWWARKVGGMRIAV
jgi:hypothetical protein